MHNLEAFLNSIDFSFDEEVFKEVEVEKVLLNKKSETFKVCLHSNRVLPYDITNSLINGSYKINNTYKCLISINYEHITDEDITVYVRKVIERLGEEKPSLVSIKEIDPIIDDDIIIFEVISDIEEETIKKEEANIRRMLADFGLKDYLITTKVNEEKGISWLKS